jgi:hypothetical protein
MILVDSDRVPARAQLKKALVGSAAVFRSAKR